MERYLRFIHAGKARYGKVEGEKVRLLQGDFVEVMISEVGSTSNRVRRIQRGPGRPD